MMNTETMEGDHSPTNKKRSNIIKWALILGIAIIVNLFLVYAVRVLYEEPAFTDFCPEKQVNEAITTAESCVAVGGQWNANMPGDKTVPAGYCDVNFTCQKGYDAVNKVYTRNVFVIFVIAGIILLVGSVFLRGSEAVSLGLSFGGVLALIVGSLSYWSDMNDVLRVVILGVALAALISIAWKQFRD
jgi:hypothetical protein